MDMLKAKVDKCVKIHAEFVNALTRSLLNLLVFTRINTSNCIIAYIL